MKKNKKINITLGSAILMILFSHHSSSTSFAQTFGGPSDYNPSTGTMNNPDGTPYTGTPTELYTNIEKIPGNNNKPTSDFPTYMKQIINFMFATIGILAMFMLMIGAYQYLMAAGNLAKADSAKDSISSALLGLALGLIAWLILYTINPDLVKLELKSPAGSGASSSGIGGIMGGTVTPGTSGIPTPVPSSYTSNAPEEIQKKAKEYAAKWGVPESIAMRMLNAESGGKIDAVSSKGASGLLQLMPGTARGLGVTDIFDVDQNLNAGYKYASQLAKQYDGNWEYAVAAYNMGPNGFDKFMAGQRNLPKETSGYVNKVMGNCSFCPQS